LGPVFVEVQYCRNLNGCQAHVSNKLALFPDSMGFPNRGGQSDSCNLPGRVGWRFCEILYGLCVPAACGNLSQVSLRAK